MEVLHLSLITGNATIEGIKDLKNINQAISLVSNTDIMTIANDNGYENIFANSLDNLHNLGDLLYVLVYRETQKI